MSRQRPLSFQPNKRPRCCAPLRAVFPRAPPSAGSSAILSMRLSHELRCAAAADRTLVNSPVVLLRLGKISFGPAIRPMSAHPCGGPRQRPAFASFAGAKQTGPALGDGTGASENPAPCPSLTRGQIGLTLRVRPPRVRPQARRDLDTSEMQAAT